MPSVIYGWPSGATSYEISFYDALRGLSSLVATGYKKTTLEFASLDERPGVLLVYPNRTTGKGKPYAFPVNEPPFLATLRWQVREAINDTETADSVDVQYPETPKWTDNEIDSAVREAIQLFNNYLQNEVTIRTTIDKLDNDDFKNIVDIVRMSYYDKTFSEWREVPQSSRRGRHQDRRYSQIVRHWDLVGGELKLYGFTREELDSEIEIKMRIPYSVPHADLSIIEIPRDDWDILSIYAQGKCYVRLAGQSSQLDRWKEDHKRNDNPITPIAKLLLKDAVDRLENRKGPRPIRRFRG